MEIIDTDKYFVELTDESRGTIGYTVVFPENLLKDIIKQNKQLTRKTQIINEIEEAIKPYQEPIELDALSLPGAIESILERKTKEYKELKRKVELMKDCPDCKVDEYKTAFEEIEKVTKKISNYLNIGCDMTKCEDCNHFESFCTNQCVCYLIEQGDSILDIINKAKGEADD